MRPAFEVSAIVQPGNQVQVVPNQTSGANPLYFFTKEKMTILAWKYLALNEVPVAGAAIGATP